VVARKVVTRRAPHVLFVNTRDTLGADVAVHQTLARQLAENGVPVSFTVNRSARDRARMHAALAEAPGVHVLECSLGRPLERGGGSRRRTLDGLANASAAPSIATLAAYIRRKQVDVLHATDRPRDALLCVLLGRLTGRASVIHMHSNCVGFGRATWWAFRHCTRVVAVSDFIRRSLEAAGVSRDRLVTVHNAVDPTHFRRDAAERGRVRMRFNIPAGAPLVGLVGRLIPYKGHEDLMQAFAAAGKDLADAHLVIAGATDGESAPYVESLRARGRQLGVIDRVHFTGFQGDTRPVYADLDVLAVPSWDEPFGLVVTEAMAMTVPVVAYRSGGIPEIITCGREGVLVAPRNTGELGVALAAVLRDPPLRSRMGAAGRRRVLSEFSPRHQAEEILAAYRSIVSGQRSPSACAISISSIRRPRSDTPTSATNRAASASPGS
jgi:glycosyltransferase involved in cell wall biosynthesis